jgi:glutamine amidotransferase
MGNLRSVVNAIEALGHQAVIASHPKALREATSIVLPGVGAFGDGMRLLEVNGWLEGLHCEVKAKGKPFLGLCLGMQLLGTSSTEHGEHQGLNWVPGVVQRLDSSDGAIRIPHVGWNDVRFVKDNGLYRNLGTERTFYFVHSYVLTPDDPSVVSGLSTYGGTFAASVEVDNICGTQFHPEKSQAAGLAVLRNFLETHA